MGISGSHDFTQDESEKQDPEKWKKFFIILAGKTNGAHKPVVRRLKSKGQTEAKSAKDADYYLVFCPVASRVGTDVDEAMENLPGDKKAVLVVMHHTLNKKQVVPRSRRVVKDRRVQLTLDCLFHRDHLLNCDLNKTMNKEINRFRPFRSKRSSCLRAASDSDNEPYRKA